MKQINDDHDTSGNRVGEGRETRRSRPPHGLRWLVVAGLVGGATCAGSGTVGAQAPAFLPPAPSRIPAPTPEPDGTRTSSPPPSPDPQGGIATRLTFGDSLGETVCPDGRIADIVIDNHSVFDLSEPSRLGRFDWVYRMANGLHMRTSIDVITRELLFHTGDCYDAEALLDSERLLRGMGFLADANTYGVRLPGGDVQVRIDTRDEWSTRVEPTFESDGAVGLSGLRFVEDNLFGTGNHIGVFYEREREQPVFGVSYYNPQTFGTRWDLSLAVARTEVGHSYHQSAFYPFVGETGRVAFRQSIDRQDRFFELLMPRAGDELARVWLPVNREYFEVGAAIRWGRERYTHTVLGAAIAGERVRYPDTPGLSSDPVEIATVPLPMAWEPFSSVRLMLVTGQRNVHYVRRRSIDTVNGNEDVRLGVEAEASFGPTLPMLSEDRDVAVGLRLSAAGAPGEPFLFGGNFAFEGRRGYEAIEGVPEWHDILAEANFWAYARPSPGSPHLFVGAVSALGGWHSRVPFQLSLGGVAGLRGYPRHVNPGGRRIVGSLEHRAYLGGPFAELLDLGTVVFVDAGRIWPGHAPFGEPAFRASAGMGIRAAFPPGSRQTFRLDVGLPLERGAGVRDLTLTVGVGQAIGRNAPRRDPQLHRSARYGISTSDFETNGLLP